MQITRNGAQSPMLKIFGDKKQAEWKLNQLLLRLFIDLALHSATKSWPHPELFRDEMQKFILNPRTTNLVKDYHMNHLTVFPVEPISLY